MILIGCQRENLINSCVDCIFKRFPHRCNVYREECKLEKINAWEWILTPESSNIEMFAHEEGIMRICFKNGLMYDYYDVPKTRFEEMKNAESKGKFLNQNLKRKYRTVRVE